MTTPTKHVDVGVFLPVGSGGWITSTTSPELPATYGYNRAVTQLAEELGLDFALSMAKWRGYGGPSKHWDHTIESLSTMSALAEATQRIKLWSTVHTMVWHPAVVAKMMATIDQVAGGRVGLNLVSGSNPFDQGQFGLWRELDHQQRYALAEEWIVVAKKLWSQARTDHDGQFFTLTDCVSDPKPSAVPTLISAGTSETGLRFAVRNCDVCFVSGATDDDLARTGSLIRDLADEYESDAGAYALFTVVPGATEAEAQRRVELYDSGVDVEALQNQAREYSTDVKENSMRTRNIAALQNPRAVSASAIVGTPEMIADRLVTLTERAGLDGITLIVPDFIDDLRIIGEEVLPLLAQAGLRSAPQTELVAP